MSRIDLQTFVAPVDPRIPQAYQDQLTTLIQALGEAGMADTFLARLQALGIDTAVGVYRAGYTANVLASALEIVAGTTNAVSDDLRASAAISVLADSIANPPVTPTP
jgi:hypothetical protein